MNPSTGARPLSGPSLAPRSSRAPRQLVVLLHGWGSSGHDLLQLAPVLARFLPDAEFLSPHGPERCDANPGGYQWFSLSAGLSVPRRAVERVLADLDAFLDESLSRRQLAAGNLALVGFSQGAMLALAAALARPMAGAVGYSGALLEVPPGKHAPELLLVHGDADDVVPVENLYRAVEALGATDARVRFHVRPALGHGIDPDGLALGGDFLRRQLLGRWSAGTTATGAG